MKDSIRLVTDLAFEAADTDGNMNLDQTELSSLLKSVAREMQIVPPTDLDVQSVLLELDEDFDKCVSKDEFYNLVMLVLDKMLESEEDLLDTLLMEKGKV